MDNTGEYVMRATMVAAHTGCGAAPDNTWASYLEGIEMGADIIEVDVLTSRDGTALLEHDDSPELLQYDFEQLSRPEIKAQLFPHHLEHEIVKLEDVLRHFAAQGVRLNLDLKSAASMDAAIALVHKLGVQKQVFTTGYSEELCSRYPDIQALLNTPVQLNPDVDYDEFAASVCEQAVKQAYCGINMNYKTCKQPIVKLAHSMGLLVWVYTVNEAEQMQRFIDMGVDAITTRQPVLLRQLL
jgi:glycerophosphoryl diester phosphodiesterase